MMDLLRSVYGSAFCNNCQQINDAQELYTVGPYYNMGSNWQRTFVIVGRQCQAHNDAH